MEIQPSSLVVNWWVVEGWQGKAIWKGYLQVEKEAWACISGHRGYNGQCDSISWPILTGLYSGPFHQCPGVSHLHPFVTNQARLRPCPCLPHFFLHAPKEARAPDSPRPLNSAQEGEGDSRAVGRHAETQGLKIAAVWWLARKFMFDFNIQYLKAIKAMPSLFCKCAISTIIFERLEYIDRRDATHTICQGLSKNILHLFSVLHTGHILSVK